MYTPRKLYFKATNLILLIVVALLAACAQLPERPYVLSDISTPRCPENKESGPAGQTTPERSVTPAYVIHYIEFDDQGWLYPSRDGQKILNGKPDRQIDCAFADISNTVKNHDVMTYFYVHGWNHSANADDPDVDRFRTFIEKEAAAAESRKVIGIYIAWQGDTISIPIINNLTFWGRKNAAERVANGRVREVFSRMKGLRDYWNRTIPGKGENCGQMVDESRTRCKIKTVMIGHSFGGLILFNSISPYLLETLMTQRDIPDESTSNNGISREIGIADLVVLLNPAFEAARYEPVHKAAMAYTPKLYEPPLLINITSTADRATKNIFPFVRYANTLFQYPATSQEQSWAIRRTPTNVDRYTTHRMDVMAKDGTSQSQPCSKETQKALSRKFFDERIKGGVIRLEPKWYREFCGGIVISHLRFGPLEPEASSQEADRINPDSDEINPYSLVWNVRVNKQFISNHNDINTSSVRNFLTSIYNDLALAPVAKIEPFERLERAKVKD